MSRGRPWNPAHLQAEGAGGQVGGPAGRQRGLRG